MKSAMEKKSLTVRGCCLDKWPESLSPTGTFGERHDGNKLCDFSERLVEAGRIEHAKEMLASPGIARRPRQLRRHGLRVRGPR